MANFKRKGPKSTRAGCLMCKPHKRQGQKLLVRLRFNEVRRMKAMQEQMKEIVPN
jgi:hypothetical protein